MLKFSFISLSFPEGIFGSGPESNFGPVIPTCNKRDIKFMVEITKIFQIIGKVLNFKCSNLKKNHGYRKMFIDCAL